MQNNEEYIRELDNKNKNVKREKQRKEKADKEARLNLIFENMPYAYEACKFDRQINPDKWF